MSKLKVAVVGCGSIAIHRHVPEYAANPNVELVAFCDLNIEVAQKLADQYGVKQVYDSHEAMLKEAKMDAVSVCTQNVDHAQVSIDAANAGCHVLCEKPMATSIEEAQQMIDAAKANNVKLMIGHNQRLMPPHVKAKEILQSGKIGKPLTFKTTFGHGGPDSWSIQGKDTWFFQKDKAFVGAMGDLGVHKIDLMRWLFDEEVAEVAAFVETLDKDADVDDNATTLLRMENGAIGTMAASWTYYKGEDNTTTIYGEKGVLEIHDDPNVQVVVKLADGTIERYSVGAIATNEAGGQVASGVIDEFVDAIANDRTPSITGESAMESLRTVLAALESTKSKTFVSVATIK
ncbi:Gfo/Idh/MocA family oxidoreductase [Shouchella clausii]|uniref:Gfo/Idh/MocA family protein n=1 Tax=Shouchella TaxID=2893057 RepID=UPI0004E77FF7|nr:MULTISPECIES: Gfo/Idh/MocA family oxidoreductase [Shouchella]ALA52035.1 Myo-inositol 2-dehydrogenase 1 [Shouchella clausii]MBU3230515.1 Gfo/Idh/MocA family oxidoreductase [Shouchella clausii]MBU3262286.1 Gfo/Idh/MocA family oxidoreductase [Shouchella clausii]MBU3507399.1 Gfo/Idh/MocA family oxidoreductase [Shouchella clausii]MBU3533546.1 Gfo/Idh/MocA family oxidoreductase [Shouchella clausii]